MDRVRVSIGPRPSRFATAAVLEGGGVVVHVDDCPSALIWLSATELEPLRDILQSRPSIKWVHVSWAGVENLIGAGLVTGERVWTSSSGAFSEPMAEHGIALALAGMRHLQERVRASAWGGPGGDSLYDREVVILGGGGTARKLVEHLTPFRARVTVVRRTAGPVAGAGRTVTADRLAAVLPSAAVVFLALALTPQTVGIIGRDELELMNERSWLVNLARGEHVVTGDLVDALRAGSIGGAALDVTDPEPLPTDHALWTLPNVILTPHTANPPELARPLIAARIIENVARYSAGEPLMATIDEATGY
jgi:phosphoglycerate dehydrogenase-like enzyme